MNIKKYLYILSANILIMAGCAENRKNPDSAQPAFTVEYNKASQTQLNITAPKNSLEQKWGIKVESIRLSAEGYMIDFRYRVLDVNKAAYVLDRKIKPYLIDEATGATFIVPAPPKVGQLRSGKNIRKDAVYFIFFANPGKYIKSGSNITVVIGDCKINNLIVL